MWQSEIEVLSNGDGHRYVISNSNGTLSFSEVIVLWLGDLEFRSYFSKLLSDSPFAAYRWETPCVTSSTISRDFEFVLLHSTSLVRTPDSRAFSSHFRVGCGIVTFANLGRNAVLVVPCPVGDSSDFGHLASFIRRADTSQLHDFWRAVAVAMNDRIDDRPVWLSTAGMGVSWLHARLDDSPKYYGYKAYRKVS